MGLLHREGLCHPSIAIPMSRGASQGPRCHLFPVAETSWSCWHAGEQVLRCSDPQCRFLSVVNNSFGNLHCCSFEHLLLHQRYLRNKERLRSRLFLFIANEPTVPLGTLSISTHSFKWAISPAWAFFCLFLKELSVFLSRSIIKRSRISRPMKKQQVLVN